MIADWIDAELRNWSRWCHAGPWPHPIPPDHAASLEGRYIAPIIEDADAPQPRAPAPNRQRAETVHRVFMEMLTQRERWALIHRYIRRTEDRIACRRMRVTQRDFDVALLAAARCVGEAFREDRVAVRA